MNCPKAWLPVFLWLAIIFSASTDALSAGHTSHLLEPFLRWLDAGISQSAVDEVHLLVRKAAHLTEYAILAILLGRAFVLSGVSQGKTLCLVLAIAALYAASDEYHQSFVKARTASVGDVFIDFCGAGIGVFLYLASRRKRKTTVSPSRRP